MSPVEGSVRLVGVKLAGVKADLMKEEVTLTFKAHLDPQMFDAKPRLTRFHEDQARINLTIEPQVAQLGLQGMQAEPPVLNAGDFTKAPAVKTPLRLIVQELAALSPAELNQIGTRAADQFGDLLDYAIEEHEAADGDV